MCLCVRRRHGFHPKPQGVRIGLPDGRPHSIDVFVSYSKKSYCVEILNDALKAEEINEPVLFVSIENRPGFELLDVC